MDRAQVVLETSNPLDVTPEDLEELAALIEQAVPVSVSLAWDDQHGSGVTGHEVLSFWLAYGTPVAETLVAEILTVTTAWAVKRHNRQKNPPRGTYVNFVDDKTGEIRRGVLYEPESSTGKEAQKVTRPYERRRKPKGRHRRR